MQLNAERFRSETHTRPYLSVEHQAFASPSTVRPFRTDGLAIAKSIALTAAIAVVLVIAAACTGDEEPTQSATATTQPTAERVSPTAAAVPEPTDMPEDSDTAEQEADGTANGSVLTEGDVMATAFDEWGSTCLNNVYPPNAPQLEDVDAGEFSTDANGLQFVTISESDGEQPKLTWEVDVQYTGWLEDGCIFDSSYTRSEPTVFPVNAVIPGWQMALTQMKIGERRRVIIPPDLAYGPTGSPPVIPANATLTFDIILIGATDPDAASALATQTADDLLLQATVEAADFNADAQKFEPNVVDYIQDVKGFLAVIPQGEITCMTAYAGSIESVEGVFSGQRQPGASIIERFDECLSDITTRNIAAGRILIINPDLSDETISCIEGRLESPTLKPMFGIFDDAVVSEQWISSHFCLNPDERLAFEEKLYENQPDRDQIGAGGTFIDVQECMVGKLGAAKYFEPVRQPDTANAEAMQEFYTNFTAFMIADIGCRQGEAGFELNDGSMMSEEAAICIAEELGDVRFGEVLLDRIWVPTVEEHLAVATAYNGCGIPTDFLGLPEGIGNLEGSDLSCILEELENSENSRETSLRAFSDIGSRNEIKAGDFVALLFGAERCGIELPGVPLGAEISDSSAMCIADKVDSSLIVQGRSAVMPSFERALEDSADCFGGN